MKSATRKFLPCGEKNKLEITGKMRLCQNITNWDNGNVLRWAKIDYFQIRQKKVYKSGSEKYF